MNKGFSLVELSIVLVILGLLTGGILAGQNLIRAAEIRAVSTELSRWITATQTFRDKYFAIPGDMRNATAFWGAMTNCGAASPSGTGTQTCDGNGDGIIDDGTGAGQTGERFTYWQQLANAGLIEGSYTAIAGSGGANEHLANENAPTSKLGAAGYMISYLAPSFAGTGTYYAVDYGNNIRFGTFRSANGPNDPALTPEEAWNIDTKMDDGRPAYGKIIASYWDNACADATANNNLDSNYRLSDNTTQCTLSFVELF